MDEIQDLHLSEIPQADWKLKDLIIILVGILLIFAIGLAVMGGILRLLNVSADQILTPSIPQSLGVAALEAISLIGGVYVFGLRRKHLGWSSIGFKKVSTGWLLGAIAVTGIAIPLSSLITLFFLMISGMPLENPQLDFLLPDEITALQAAGMILLAGMIAPIGEEIVFRGILYRFLRMRSGILPAVLLSSVIFAIVHADLAVGLTAFVLGIILALVFEYSRSLWTAILIHALNNSVRLALLYIVVNSGIISGV